MIHEKANYKKQKIPEYSGNPLIEALPDILEDNQAAIRALANLPTIKTEERLFSPNLKGHLLPRIKSFLYPFPINLKLERKISVLIRQSYIPRNPLELEYKKKLKMLNEFKENNININDTDDAALEDLLYENSKFPKTAECLLVTGISGVGKTRTVEPVLDLYPQLIRHESYRGQTFTKTQIVWLKIDCPYDGDITTLYQFILKAIDDITGERWLEKYGYLTRSKSTMLMNLMTLLSNYCVGILVIDEIQNIVKLKDAGAKVLNLFVNFTNMLSVPILFIGNSKAKDVFKHVFSLSRRAQSSGTIEISPLEKNEKKWDKFIERLWKFNILKEDVELTQELKEELFKESQGVIGIAVVLYVLTQSNALLNNKKFTKKLIKETADQELQLTKPMIVALRSDDPSEIKKYEDLFAEEPLWEKIERNIELMERVEDVIKDLDEKIQTEKKSKKDNVLVRILSSNLFANFKSKQIEEIIDKIISRNPGDITEEELTTLVMGELIHVDKEKINKKRTTIPPGTKADLIKLYNKALKDKKHPYDLFKEKGYIKNPFEETKVL